MSARRIMACGLVAAVAVLAGCGANTSGSGAAQQAAAVQAPGAQPATAQAGGAVAQNSGAATAAASPAEAAPAAAQAAAASQPNPAGDIPDSQTFVTYSPPDGRYSVEVPEGWARSASGSDTIWMQQYDGVSLRVLGASRLPAIAAITASYLKGLDSALGAVQLGKTAEVSIHGARVFRASYFSASAPDPVTDKSLKLENEAYLFFGHGHLAALRLWAPAGADNVDQWRRISRSFAWK